MSQGSWADVAAEVSRVFTCDHSRTVLVYKVSIDSRLSYRRQCQVCGSAERALKKDSLTEGERASAQEYDEQIQKAWHEARELYRRGLVNDAKEQEQRAWWAWYSDYLLTEEWQQRREQVLRRADRLCEGCRVKPAEQVHHLTYERAGNELLFDLVAVCRECHQQAHPYKQINRQGVA